MTVPTDRSGDDGEEQGDGDPVAIVSQHHIATEASLDALAQGGTADAAVACTLSVVEPWFSSALGGGTWTLYYDAESNEVTSLDGVGPVAVFRAAHAFRRPFPSAAESSDTTTPHE